MQTFEYLIVFGVVFILIVCVQGLKSLNSIKGRMAQLIQEQPFIVKVADKRWEYYAIGIRWNEEKREYLSFSFEERTRVLSGREVWEGVNRLGRKGFELISVVPESYPERGDGDFITYILWFKRQLILSESEERSAKTETELSNMRRNDFSNVKKPKFWIDPK